MNSSCGHRQNKQTRQVHVQNRLVDRLSSPTRLPPAEPQCTHRRPACPGITLALQSTAPVNNHSLLASGHLPPLLPHNSAWGSTYCGFARRPSDLKRSYRAALGRNSQQLDMDPGFTPASARHGLLEGPIRRSDFKASESILHYTLPDPAKTYIINSFDIIARALSIRSGETLVNK